MEGYKLTVIKRKNGLRRGMSATYPLRQECLISLEADFQKYKEEPDTVELHLLRVDSQGFRELKKYVNERIDNT